jgi:enoyl-CoA hydratase
MEFETIIYESKNEIGYITLNIPERHNALSYQLLDDIDAVFDYAEADNTAKVIVLKGNGKSFCSGFDNDGSYYRTPPEGGWEYKNSYEILNKKIYAKYPRILYFPKPTIAQIHGHCIDGGCYLQLLCDISVAADDAILGHPAQLWGGAQSLPLWQFYLGIKKARYVLMTGRRFSGKEAEQMGLITLSVPRDKLEEEVNKIATEMAGVPADGMLHCKICLNTDLRIRGMDALFDYYGQMNRYGRFLIKR